MMPELKPCRRCGGHPFRSVGPNGLSVSCNDCPNTTGWCKKEAAIKIWNTRPDGGDSLRDAAQSAYDDLCTAAMSADLLPIELRAMQTLQAALAAKDGE